MATTAQHPQRDRARGMMLGARTVAQTFCLALGIPLVLAGIVGFFVDSSFTAGEAPPGDLLLGLEVNGWHNIAHIATGAVLLLGAPKARTAITALMIFAMGYVVVTAWGFIDGESVFRLLAINEADRWFHVFLTLAAFIGIALSGGLAARGSEEDAQARRT